MVKKVTVIKAAKAQKHTQEERRLKVCGYARVSTGSQAQATSYTAQVEYYTEKIESNPLWEFAGVYADEGISGTNVKHRDEFQMMISDCEDGNIDLILTKSITRFARNTVECIQTIRKQKQIGGQIMKEIRNRLQFLQSVGLDYLTLARSAGTLSGAPKIRACEIIEEQESEPRGVYGGALGYLDFTGNMDTCIAIRMAAKKNGTVTVQAGGGIVADSVPHNEYMESANKAKAVMNAIERASEVDG